MKNDYFFIYETTNLVNNKKYRGIHKTKNINDNYIGSGVSFEFAIKKYGKENFKREILEYCNSYDELIEKEKLYVNEEWVKDRENYNTKTGGQSAGILSEESKKKISDTLKEKYKSGKIKPNPARKGMPPWNKGLKMSDEIKEKFSKAGKKRFDDDKNHPLKIFGNKIPHNKGKKTGQLSDKTKNKISETLKERYKTKNQAL
jgi:hypothetical protein